MSEEDYYINILEEDDDSNKRKNDWEKEYYPYEETQSDYYQQQSSDGEQYKQEFYGEGYYQDYQSQREFEHPQKDKGRKWFWLGVLIATGISAVVMVIFNFIGTAYHPGLAFLEIVLLLVCCTLPGLFVRKVGKGILGGMLIFALQFFIPIAIFYGLDKNPTSFFSPYFLFLNSVGLILNGYNDLKSFSIIPIDPAIFDQIDQYTGYAAFVWVFDLLIMFGVMISLVIASSWLCSNLFTKKAKNVWTWCLLPGQVFFVILNLIVVPWLMLSVSSTVQTGGALAAGAGNIAEASMPFISGNFSDFSDNDFNEMLVRFDAADIWFKIAQGNYKGLNSLMFFKLLQRVSGNYGFIVSMFDAVITAGFELLLAIKPLAHGVFDNSTTNPEAEVDGFYYQYKKFIAMYDDFPTMFNFNANSTKPSETELAEMEVEVGEIINNVDLLLDLHFKEAVDHILIAQEILATINPDDLRNVSGNDQVNNALNQVADQLDLIMNVTNEYGALIPIAMDILFESPSLFQAMFSMLIGNIRLLMGWQFDQSQYYFQNATLELMNVQTIFTPARRAEIVATGSTSALGFFDFFNDVINLLIPLISLEGYIAGTMGGIIHALDEYIVDTGPPANCTLSETDFTAVFNYMGDSIGNATLGVTSALDATTMMNQIETRSNASEYALMSLPAYYIISSINGIFQPEPFALILADFSNAINATYGMTYAIYHNDEPLYLVELDAALNNINNSIAIIDSYDPGTPVYALRGILTAFQTSILDMKEVSEPLLGSGLISNAVPQIESIMASLYTNIHNIVDEGLPP